MKFEDLDGPAEVEDPSRAKGEMTRQEKETPKETNFEKLAMSKKRYPLPKSEEVKQALHRPLKGQRNGHARQMGRKRKRCSRIWFGT